MISHFDFSSLCWQLDYICVGKMHPSSSCQLRCQFSLTVNTVEHAIFMVYRHRIVSGIRRLLWRQNFLSPLACVMFCRQRSWWWRWRWRWRPRSSPAVSAGLSQAWQHRLQVAESAVESAGAEVARRRRRRERQEVSRTRMMSFAHSVILLFVRVHL